MSVQTEIQYPYEIWLSVSYTGLAPDKARKVSEQLSHLPGWRTSITDEDRAAFRYTYVTGRQQYIVRQARSILMRAGLTNPSVSSFDIWRIEFRLRPVSSLDRWVRLTAAIREPEVVLNTSGSADRSVLKVEVHGKPTEELLRRMRTHLRPFVA